MIIYLLIGVTLTVVLLGIDNTNPVGERLFDNVDKRTVFLLVIDIVLWPLVVVFIILGIIKEFTK